MVKNLPANAGGTGSSPGPGRSYMPQSNQAHVPQLLSLFSKAQQPQLLSLSATTTEACTPRDRAPQQEKPPQMRSPHTATKSSPRSLQLEKACAQQWRPNTAKNFKNFLKIGKELEHTHEGNPEEENQSKGTEQILKTII